MLEIPLVAAQPVKQRRPKWAVASATAALLATTVAAIVFAHTSSSSEAHPVHRAFRGESQPFVLSEVDSGGGCVSYGVFIAAMVMNLFVLVCATRCALKVGHARGVRSRTTSCDPWSRFGVNPPIFMLPQVDVDGDNDVCEVCFGEVDGGVEVTVVFKDEDRPSQCQDCIYDFIRRPLFGRAEDIETFTFLRGPSGEFESLKFEGTASGEQTWAAQMPAHETATIPLSEFQTQDGRVVVWVNVWNHLFGPKNNNPTMEMVAQGEYVCSRGTRAETDARYAGLITKVA